MKRVPANRFVIFALIACAGAAIDLRSKQVVFRDLGYPRDLENPRGAAVFQPGQHQVFDRAPPAEKGIAPAEGESRSYLDGWLKFRLYTNFNQGALWGIGQGWTGIFAFASIAAIAGILVWLFIFGAANSRWLTVSLALILSGTIGNLWDRLAMHGCVDHQGQPIHAVRDFFLFTFGDWHYPIFNFADAFLVTGAIMLGVQAVFMPAPNESAKTEGTPDSKPKSEAKKQAGKGSSEKPDSATSAA